MQILLNFEVIVLIIILNDIETGKQILRGAKQRVSKVRLKKDDNKSQSQIGMKKDFKRKKKKKGGTDESRNCDKTISLSLIWKQIISFSTQSRSNLHLKHFLVPTYMKCVVVQPGRQLSTTQQFAHYPSYSGMEERIGNKIELVG